jgi:hypothetical protein
MPTGRSLYLPGTPQNFNRGLGLLAVESEDFFNDVTVTNRLQDTDLAWTFLVSEGDGAGNKNRH